MHVAKEMGTAAAILNKKKGDERESEEDRYRSVRNLADAIVTFEGQWKLRHGSEPAPRRIPPWRIQESFLPLEEPYT